LKENLQYVYGWDIDRNEIEKCIHNLNCLVNPLGINVNWNIYKNDSLEEIENFQFNLFQIN